MSQKVLAVDDSSQIRAFYARVFKNDPEVELVAAANGNEALALLSEHPDIALILLDIQMPVMDGPTFLRELRQLPSPAFATPVIVVATEAADAVVQAQMPSARAFFEKPCDPQELRAAVHEALAERP